MEKIKAKKSLGQNFLKDEGILQKIAQSFDTKENDVIIEVGSGMGALTKYLVKKLGNLYCYELDERMKEYLNPYESDRCQVIYGNFLKQNLQEDIKKNYEHLYVIANLPYYITTPIIEHIIHSDLYISGMTFLVQKEVALRFVAKPKSKDYGYFTVYLNHFFDSKILCDVDSKAFEPSPKVTSSVVQMIRKSRIENMNIEKFKELLLTSFHQKRKTLKNNLKNDQWQQIVSLLSSLGYNENVRAEELSYSDYVLIYQVLYPSA